MKWHTTTVAADALGALVTEIQRAAGTITRCERLADLVRVTWTSAA